MVAEGGSWESDSNFALFIQRADPTPRPQEVTRDGRRRRLWSKREKSSVFLVGLRRRTRPRSIQDEGETERVAFHLLKCVGLCSAESYSPYLFLAEAEAEPMNGNQLDTGNRDDLTSRDPIFPGLESEAPRVEINLHMTFMHTRNTTTEKLETLPKMLHVHMAKVAKLISAHNRVAVRILAAGRGGGQDISRSLFPITEEGRDRHTEDKKTMSGLETISLTSTSAAPHRRRRRRRRRPLPRSLRPWTCRATWG